MSDDMPVVLVDYDETWPAQFAAERERILDAVGGDVVGVEHIGSTAVPGIAAKPIIDIMLLIEDLADAPRYVPLLAPLRYTYVPYSEIEIPERRWFCKPNKLERTHHLHLTFAGSGFHIDHLLFRDYLRAHADVAADYEALKRDLAARFRDDRDAYTLAKSDFITGVLALARASAWRARG